MDEKTTYITNDYTRKVHDFKSLAKTKQELEQDLELKQQQIAHRRTAAAVAKTFEDWFRPEYTHQCVGKNEVFAGYRPLEEVLRQARQELSRRETRKKGCVDGEHDEIETPRLLHKSHAFHVCDDSELDIRVSLAPSCKACFVQIQHSPSPKSTSNNDPKTVSPEPNPKRVKLSSDKKRTLTEAEILDLLRPFLPPMVEQLPHDFLSQPIGEVLEEYTIIDKGNTKRYIIALADGRDPSVVEYHHKIQPLALSFIENADNIDVADTQQGGFWSILYVFEKHENTAVVPNEICYSFVGYVTLFHFWAIFHKPHPGIIVRICQALVLPPFQGQGHASRLLQGVYRLAHRNHYINSTDTTDQDLQTIKHKIVQVNVEDPTPAFMVVRHKADYTFVMRYGKEWGFPGLLQEDDKTVVNVNTSFFTGLTESKAKELSVKSKLIPHQVHIVHDLIKLKLLQDGHFPNTCNQDKEDRERRFRLMVKKRLNKEHREELGALGNKDSQKAFLADLFEKRLKDYKRILKIWRESELEKREWSYCIRSCHGSWKPVKESFLYSSILLLQ